MNTARNGFCLAVLVVLAGWPAAARGQSAAARGRVREFAANIVVPQGRSLAADRSRQVRVTGVKAEVSILEQAATTTLEIALANPGGAQLEAELLVPVPEGAAVRGFAFEGAAPEATAELLAKDAAVAAYKAIVSRLKDPALLEFAGYNLIRSSVFPVPARGSQKLRLTYEHLLGGDGERVDYVLPRTESIHYSVPWEVTVRIRSKRAISTVYSPSHELAVTRAGDRGAVVQLGAKAMSEPGPLQLSYLCESGAGMTASLLAYPDPKTGGGYFLLLAGLPAERAGGEEAPAVKREVIVVIDRSGSMSGEKLAQAQAAALQVVEGLHDGEAFNVIDYSSSLSSFADAPVVKNKTNTEQVRHYIRRLRAGGGTNIHDTLVEALRQKPSDGRLGLVLFLTDGLPTIGVRSEVAIRTAAIAANVHKRRIFTFGVGYDVNAPLLTHLAENSRAVSTFVLPKEDVEVKVSQVYRRLSGPVLAGPELTVVDAAGEPAARRVREVLPGRLPDLFEGDRLVLLGQYQGEAPLHFRLAGNYRGKSRTFKFDFKLDKATTRNSFVPRLWASRKIAMLIDEIRQAGAGSGEAVQAVARPAGQMPADPRMKELVDEIVRLSVEFGILTEYTAFLAKEGTDLSRRDDMLEVTNDNLIIRAQGDRSGRGGLNQDYNTNYQRRQEVSNLNNWYYDQDMNRVQITSVQQVNDRAFFQRGNRWVDGAAINAKAGASPDRTVTIGSPEFMRLVDRLVAEHRQGTLSMSGEILLRVGGENVLITP